MRLIDAEHLTKWILSWWEKTEPTSEYLKGADILNQIDREPTIDAVEVVRCKDCRWHDNRYGDVCHNPRYGDGWANYPPPYVDEDYWCKDGERKGGDSE